MQWQKISVVGVGLLGGSLGLAVRQKGLAEQVAGYIRRDSARQECLEAGAADWVSTQLDEVVKGSDLIVICTPVTTMAGLAESMKPHLRPDAVVTDVGSVKAEVTREMERILGGAFIGSHPMAGSEQVGVRFARQDLFEKALCVITPTEKTLPASLETVRALWKGMGMCCLETGPAEHDRLVAMASHLPHMVAAILSETVLDSGNGKQMGEVCATGFRDTSRVASGSPEVWRDICLTNRQALLEAMDAWEDRWRHFRMALEASDADEIFRILLQSKQLRDTWLDREISRFSGSALSPKNAAHGAS